MALNSIGLSASGTGQGSSAGRRASRGGAAAAPGPLAELCTACRVRCLPLFRPFDPDDLRFVQRCSPSGPALQPTRISCTDERGSGPYTLWDGWAYLYCEVPEIGAAPRRQILEILLPGDVFGLGTALTGYAGDAVRALTPGTVCVHNLRIFAEIFTERLDHPLTA
jgi:hypothetical protein